MPWTRLRATERLGREQMAAQQAVDRARRGRVGGGRKRLLRSFGVSLVVPEEHDRAVAEWIDEHYLGVRLVHFRVPRRVVNRPAPHVGSGDLLHTKRQLRADSPVYEWREHELRHRARLVCATTMDEFRHAAGSRSQVTCVDHGRAPSSASRWVNPAGARRATPRSAPP